MSVSFPLFSSMDWRGGSSSSYSRNGGSNDRNRYEESEADHSPSSMNRGAEMSGFNYQRRTQPPPTDTDSGTLDYSALGLPPPQAEGGAHEHGHSYYHTHHPSDHLPRESSSFPYEESTSLGSFLTPPQPPRVNSLLSDIVDEDGLEERRRSSVQLGRQGSSLSQSILVGEAPATGIPYRIPYYQSHCFHPPSQRPTIYYEPNTPDPNLQQPQPQRQPIYYDQYHQHSLSSALAQDAAVMGDHHHHHPDPHQAYYYGEATSRKKRSKHPGRLTTAARLVGRILWAPIAQACRIWRYGIGDHWKPLIVGGSFVTILLASLLLFLLLPRQPQLQVLTTPMAMGDNLSAATASGALSIDQQPPPPSAFTVELVDGGPVLRVRATKLLQLTLRNANWVGGVALKALQMRAIWHLMDQQPPNGGPSRVLLGTLQMGPGEFGSGSGESAMDHRSDEAALLAVPKRHTGSLQIPMDLEHDGDPVDDLLYTDFLRRCYQRGDGSITVGYNVTALISHFGHCRTVHAYGEETLPCPIDQAQIEGLLRQFKVVVGPTQKSDQ